METEAVAVRKEAWVQPQPCEIGLEKGSPIPWGKPLEGEASKSCRNVPPLEQASSVPNIPECLCSFPP